MRRTLALMSLLAAGVLLWPVMTFAQGDPRTARTDRGPFSVVVDGLYSSQGSADLDGGGSFSADRSFARIGGYYSFGGAATVGLTASRGYLNYDFDVTGQDVFENINDLRLSLPVRFRAGGANVFFSPSLRYDYEQGASRDDGRTYGFFAGAAWRVSDTLSIGPAFGAFTQIEDDATEFFPALLIDWDITDRLSLTTGPTLGATQGPGLTLSYQQNERLSFGLTGRRESIRFRLNDEGIAPNGVGEDSSIPVVASVTYSPFPGGSISAFAGAELAGQLTLDDANGNQVDRRDYDAAPVFGAAVRFAF